MGDPQEIKTEIMDPAKPERGTLYQQRAREHSQYLRSIDLFKKGWTAPRVGQEIGVSRAQAFRYQRRGRKEGLLTPDQAIGVPLRGPVPGETVGPQAISLSNEDLAKLTEMASLGCTAREMAARLQVSECWLRARLADTPSIKDAVNVGESRLKVSLRRKQVQIALNDKHPAQATMLIFLGKVVLSQSERVKVKLESEEDAMQVLRNLFPDVPEDAFAALSGTPDGQAN